MIAASYTPIYDIELFQAINGERPHSKNSTSGIGTYNLMLTQDLSVDKIVYLILKATLENNLKL